MALTAFPTHGQSHQERYFLSQIQRVEIVTISARVRNRIEPRHYDEDVDIDPPDQKQREIKPSQPRRIFASADVGAQTERRHERNEVQKNNNIGVEQIRYIAVEKHFEIRPNQLIRKPQAHP